MCPACCIRAVNNVIDLAFELILGALLYDPYNASQKLHLG
jgi:hypothetical protein